MKVGYAELGKMGFNMVERLVERGHYVVAFDRNRKSVDDIAKKEVSLPIPLPRSCSR